MIFFFNNNCLQRQRFRLRSSDDKKNLTGRSDGNKGIFYFGLMWKRDIQNFVNHNFVQVKTKNYW